MQPTKVTALIGGQYGSEGKGNIAAAVCYDRAKSGDPFRALVRSGGPNAGHTVYKDDQKVVYHHLPSGTLHSPESALYLAAGAALYVPKLLEEIETTGCANRLYIDPGAVIITDDHRRLEEEMVGRNGSTAQGVGAATADRIMRRARTAAECPELQLFIGNSRAAYRGTPGDIFLEGTQGAALSLYYGFYPYCTSRDTSVAGLLSECQVPPRLLDRTILVFRTFPIRVAGNSGPMDGECEWEDVAVESGTPAETLRAREVTTTTKRQRRVARWDWELFYRSVQTNGPTELALTFADYLRYGEAQKLRTAMETASGVPVRWMSSGPRITDVVRLGSSSSPSV